MEVGHTTVTPGADSRLSRQLLEVEEATNEVTRPFVDTRDIPTVAVFIFTTIAREGECAVDLSERLEGLCRGVIDRLGSLPVGGEAIQILGAGGEAEGRDKAKRREASAKNLLICSHDRL